jgi:hypothetical protein
MIWVERGAEEFYDLEADPYERVDLLQGDMSDEARMNYEELKNRMAELRSR